MADIIQERQEIIRDLAIQGALLAVAWSGGKDSTVALSLAIEGYKLAAREQIVFPLYVVTADTGIENPAVNAYQRRMVSHLQHYAEREKIDIRILTARPTLASSWPVQVIGGRSLPVFSNSAHRSCSIDLKREPSKRALRGIVPGLKKELSDRVGELGGDAYWRMNHLRNLLDDIVPLTIVGTRFGESASRDARMTERGDIAGAITRNEDGFDVLPLIADFTLDDVWEYLANAGTGEGFDYRAFAPNFQDTVTIYRDASGECVIVAGLRAEKQAAACGARHGCALCTVAGSTDKSMETMLVQSRYRHMEGLNRLRDYLVESRYDWDKRRWTPRSIDKDTGHIRIAPDTFHPDECANILAYAMTLDIRELERAERLRAALARHDAGESVEWPDPHLAELAAQGKFDEPYAREMAETQFQLIGPGELILIDFVWSRYGSHPPFHALSIYRDIYQRGLRVDPPRLPAATKSPTPTPRWIPATGSAADMQGLFDPIIEAISETCPADYAVATADGTKMAAHRTSDVIGVDLESAYFVLDYEADRLLENHHAGGSLPAAAADFYLRFGTVSLPKGRGRESHDMVRHSQLLAACGISPAGTRQYPDGSISDTEHRLLKRKSTISAVSSSSATDRRQDAGPLFEQLNAA